MKDNKILLTFISAFAVMLVFALIVIIPRVNNDNDVSSDSISMSEYFEPIIYDDVIGEPQYDNMPEGVFYRSVTTRTVLSESGSRLVLKYPTFEGFKGLNFNSEINALVLNYTKKMHRQNADGFYSLVDLGAKVVYEIEDFEVVYGSDYLISIVFRGFYESHIESSYTDSKKNAVCYSLNIELKNKEIITSKDLISDFYALKDSFLRGKMELSYSDKELFLGVSYSYMIDQYKPEYKIFPDMYITDKGIYIIFLIPFELGGKAIYFDKFEDTRSYINMDLLSNLKLVE